MPPAATTIPARTSTSCAPRCSSYLDRGYTVVKMKIGGEPLADDRSGSRRCCRARRGSRPGGRRQRPLRPRHGDRLRASCCARTTCSGTRRPATRSTSGCRRSSPNSTRVRWRRGRTCSAMQDARNLIRYGGMRPDRDWLQFDCALSYGLCEYLRTLGDAHANTAGRWSRCIPHGGHQMSLEDRGRPWTGRQRELSGPVPALRRLSRRRAAWKTAS